MSADGKFLVEVLCRAIGIQVEVYANDGDTVEFGTEGKKLRVIEKEGNFIGVAGEVKRVSILLLKSSDFIFFKNKKFISD